MQIEYVVLGGIAALTGFFVNFVLTMRNVYSTTKKLDNNLRIAEENLNTEISHTSFDEFKLTPAGRELLQLIGTEEALAKLSEPFVESVSTEGGVIHGKEILEISDASINLRERLTVMREFKESSEEVDKLAKSVLGTLAEEASSEIVQQELEALGKVINENIDNVMERASAFAASIAQVKEEFRHVQTQRDLSKEELELHRQNIRETVQGISKQIKK
jgi:chromosome segregation ATPase